MAVGGCFEFRVPSPVAVPSGLQGLKLCDEK